MVDRGGLDYTLRTRNAFSRDFTLFRQEIGKSVAGIRLLKAEIAGIKDVQRETLADIAAVSRAQGNANKQRKKGNDEAIKGDQERLAQAKALEQQIRSQQAAARRAAQVRRRDDRIRAQAARQQAQFAREQVAASRRQEAAQRRLNDQLAVTNRRGNRIGFTFRRLVGIFAVFTAARAAVAGFNAALGEAIRFNDTIERSNLGLASLFQNVADVRDETGQLVDAADAFPAALAEARRQNELLRRDSLRTIATFEELQFARQVATAPGLQAGLDLDEIREFSVQVSQAAAAIRLPQNQLAEEVRNILRGTVQGRTTQLAAIFGGSPEEINAQIREAREAGELFEFLDERLGGFNEASELATETFSGLLARIRDAFGFAGGRAALGLFNELKITLNDIFELLIEDPDADRILPNERTVAVLSEVFDGLADAVRAVREGLQGIDSQVFQDVARLVGTTFRTLGSILAGLFQGVVLALSDIQSLLSLIVSPFRQLFESVSGIGISLADVVAFLTRAAVLLVTARTATQIWAAASLLLANRFERLRTAVAFLRAPLLLIPAAFVAALAIIQRITNAVNGSNLSLVQTGRIIVEGIVSALNEAITRIRLFFDEANLVADINQSNEALEKLGKSAEAEFERASKAFEAGKISVEEFTAAEEKAVAVFQKIERIANGNIERLDDFKTESEELLSSLDFFENRLNDILSGQDGQEDLEGLKTTVNEILNDLTNFTFGGKIAEVTQEELDKLTEIEAQAIISEADATNAERLQQALQAGVRDSQLAVLNEQNRLASVQAQLQAAELKASVTRREAQEQVDNARQVAGAEQQLEQITNLRKRQNGDITDEQRRGLEAGLQLEFALRRQLAVERQLTAERAKSTAEVEIQQVRLQEQQLQVEGALSDGFGRAFENFADRFGSAFQAGINIASGALQQFTQFLTQTIVDGFVNVGRTGEIESFFDNIEEKAGQLLQNIASLILQQLIQLAVARAVLGGAAGAQQGGLIDGQLSLHRGGRVIGFDGGGAVPNKPGQLNLRPSHIHPKDTVNAWLQPNEFVEPVSAVKTYGADLFEAFRRHMIDPVAARALLGARRISALRVQAKRGPVQGFQTGGLAGDAEAAAPRIRGGNGGGDDRIVAALPVSEQELDRLNNNDTYDKTQFDWLRRNAADVDSILKSGRKN